MLVNYLRVAFRNIRRNKLYSLINIGCLAIGIAVAMTILLYVVHEHTYDRWQANAGRIFKASTIFNFGGSSSEADYLSFQAGPMIQRADARVGSFMRIYKPWVTPVLRTGNSTASAFASGAPVIFADSNFFHFFSFRLIRGNPDRALDRPNTVVLSARAAKKYFGSEDAIGKTIIYNHDYKLEVTGISTDPPSNSTINYDLVGSISSLETMKDMAEQVSRQGLQMGNFFTWLYLKDPSAAGAVAQTMSRLSTREPGKESDPYHLTALPAIHLSASQLGANTNYLSIFPAVATLVLLLALINYMSLSTARSAIRAKEIGVRKVLGAGRGSIAGQFYTESAMYVLLSFIAGIVLFLLFKQVFLHQLDMTIDSSFLLTAPMFGCYAGLLIVVVLLSGSYPSLILSAFKPVAVLYGKVSRKVGGERVRKGFLVFQFVISMCLILCSVIIRKELYFLRHTDTGSNREHVIMIPFNSSFQRYAAFKRAVESLPGIARAGTSQYEPYTSYNAASTTPRGAVKPIMLPVMASDSDFFSVLDIKLRPGAVLSPEMFSSRTVLLNETAVRDLRLGSDPVGQSVQVYGVDFKVGGVINNFNYESLHRAIGPYGLILRKSTDSLWGNNGGGFLLGKTQPHVNLPTLIDQLKTIYAGYDHRNPFSYRFLDDVFDQLYRDDERLESILGMFTVVTIFIACLGLFALATFSAQQRVKEIGIRKVLGASTGSIGQLLVLDFLGPILLAILIAFPLSWWAMHRWLQDFAYQTVISWWLFPAAGLGLLLIAVATVLERSLRAGRANPVVNLRME